MVSLLFVKSHGVNWKDVAPTISFEFNKDINFGVAGDGAAGFATERGDIKFYFSEAKDFEGKYTDVFSVEVKSSVSGGERVVSGNINKKRVNLFNSKNLFIS